jgi:ABC-2 type transport system permease protein
MLKGNTLVDLWPQVWPILVFMTVVILIGLRFYKRTLD